MIEMSEEYKVECIVPFWVNGNANWGRYRITDRVGEEHYVDISQLEAMLGKKGVFRLGEQCSGDDKVVYWQNAGKPLVRIFMTPRVDKDLKSYDQIKDHFDVYG